MPYWQHVIDNNNEILGWVGFGSDSLFLNYTDKQTDTIISAGPWDLTYVKIKNTYNHSPIESIPSDIEFKLIEKRLKDITRNYVIILGMYFTFSKFDIPEEKFADKLIEYYKNQINDSSKNDDSKKRILKLFKQNNPIRLAIKSKALASEATNLYISSRILTDIRPVFSSKEEENLIGQIIVNNLRLSYRNNDNYKDIFISFDEENLKELRQTIDRAIKKTELLKTKFIQNEK